MKKILIEFNWFYNFDFVINFSIPKLTITKLNNNNYNELIIS